MTRADAHSRSRELTRARFAPLAVRIVSLAMVATAATFCILAARAGWGALAAYLAAINLTTFLAYFFDKTAARAQWRRVPERVLHLLAAVGGSPAALVGQELFRHKTIKRSFRLRFWIIVAAQAVLLAAWAWFRWSSRLIAFR